MPSTRTAAELAPGPVHHTSRSLDHATLDHGLANGLVESTNTKIRVLTRIAFVFTKPEALIALGMLVLGGYCPPLIGRVTAK